MDSATPHTRSLRKGRHSALNQIYLVTFCATDRRPRFIDWRSGSSVVNELRRSQIEGKAETLCYVVMPDHVHWLLRLLSGELSALIRSIKSRSAIQYNHHAGTSGAIWQSGFHDHAVRNYEEVRALARYVVANPLRKGLVTEIGHYPLWDAVWLDGDHRGQVRSFNPLFV